jgi:hypothetical protein
MFTDTKVELTALRGELRVHLGASKGRQARKREAV